MPSIKLLPENLINQIAAGEVVERPASVIKELVENAVDAGAKRITIEVNEGGENFMRVTDDGSGMDKEDALMAFERHATSKIATNEDLFNINSLGFRGEAIASIASVSYMTLQTKKRGSLEGTIVICEGGRITKNSSIGVPEGTQIEVKQLFFNTPARRKYLKNPLTEYGHILDTVTGIALAFPQVAFKMVHDDKPVFELPSTEDCLVRIRALLGRNISDELLPVFYGHSQIGLTGYVGKPLIARGNRNGQYLFVNGREVKSHVLAYAVKQGFHSLLPKEKNPVFLLFFEINAKFVDVNVHPRKQEVRFADEKEIFRIVLHSCEKALDKYVLAPSVGTGAPENYYTERKQQSLDLDGNTAVTESPVAVGVAEAPVEANFPASTFEVNPTSDVAPTFEVEKSPALYGQESSSEDRSGTAEIRVGGEEILPLAQIGNSYILCEQGSRLIIVDQHAAHERIRYTEIIEQYDKKEKNVQQLLMPEQFELSHKEVAVLNDNMEILKGMGFEIEPFGGNTFSVHAVPAFIVKQDLRAVILGLIDDIENNASKGDFTNRRERALIYMACRSAVKFGDKLSTEEQKALLKKLQTLAKPYTCPHGRPTMVTMTFEELERRFGRKYV
jgi:DNA mismatch repair protein MutL